MNAGRRGGTGMVWSEDGLVVTASHVVGHHPTPTVTLQDGREVQAKVIGRDPYTDVALLRVEASGLAPVEPGSVDGVKVGQFVLALANASGRRVSATAGMVTGHRRSMRGFWGVFIVVSVVAVGILKSG